MKVDIAGVYVDNISKQEALERIGEFIRSGKPHYAVTTYSEFVVFANKDIAYKSVLNQADLNLADGVGILWAAKYLDQPYKTKLSALWGIVTTGASIIFKRNSLNEYIQEQISGSRLLFDLAAYAATHNFSLALLGSIDGVAAKTAQVLKKKFPSLKVNIAIAGGKPFTGRDVEEINRSNSDILLVAYQPPRQELWIAQNLDKLNVKFAMGLGGTFDYVAGKRTPAPEFFHRIGLEWFWRLITQPWRIKRMWNAIPVFIAIIYKYKISKLKT